MIINEQTGILMADAFEKGSIVIFAISKNEIDIQARYRLKMQIDELKKLKPDVKNILVINFQGYDSDPRELYNIPEVCNYSRAVFREIPDIFYFIDILSYTFAIMLNAIFTATSQITTADNKILE